MGTPSSLRSLACTQAFQEKKIKSITFQHGVTAEISELINLTGFFIVPPMEIFCRV